MLTIQSQAHPYSVEVAESLAQAIAQASSGEAQKKNAYYLIDRAVYELYRPAFAGIDASARILAIEATEQQKSYEQIGPLFTWLLEKGFRRDCVLMVVGGGVAQDIGCFIASVLFRGAKWELFPTTLLAQCDSCIGSKSSINIGSYKNQIGTFYPPHKVHMVFDVLKTLPADEIRSGLGEAIKLALIAGDSKVDEIKKLLDRYQTDPRAIEEIVLLALRIKKSYIEQDEFDRGIRNLLNYGHTFGHAYESATQYGIPHGIAVVLGMMAATFFSERLGYVPAGYTRKLMELFRPYYTPYEKVLANADLEKVLGAMKLDKKNAGGKIVCILTKGAGAMEKIPLQLEEQVRPMLSEFLREYVCR